MPQTRVGPSGCPRPLWDPQDVSEPRGTPRVPQTPTRPPGHGSPVGPSMVEPCGTLRMPQTPVGPSEHPRPIWDPQDTPDLCGTLRMSQTHVGPSGCPRPPGHDNPVGPSGCPRPMWDPQGAPDPQDTAAPWDPPWWSPVGPSGHVRAPWCPVPSCPGARTAPRCDLSRGQRRFPGFVLWLMTNAALWAQPQPGLSLLWPPHCQMQEEPQEQLWRPSGSPGKERFPDGRARYKGTGPGPVQGPVQDWSGPKVTSCPDLGVCELQIAPEQGQGHWMCQERPQSQHSSCPGSAPASKKSLGTGL
ncbi:uncharacterized protein ACIQIH_020099 [Cyanocitta cristata]